MVHLVVLMVDGSAWSIWSDPLFLLSRVSSSYRRWMASPRCLVIPMLLWRCAGPVWPGRGAGPALIPARVSVQPAHSEDTGTSKWTFPGLKDSDIRVRCFRSVPVLCADRDVVQEDEELDEEVTGSLLRGEGQGQEDEGQEDSCPPLLLVSPVPQRPQSSLHCINLSVQQVCPQSRSTYCNH